MRRAARRTLASSASVELRIDGARALGVSSAPALGSGEFDFAAGSGEEAIDLGEVGHQEPGNEQVIFAPTRVYLQPKGQNTSVLPRGKRWVLATLGGSETVSTNFPAFALQAEGVSPQLMLAEIAGGAVAASPLGSSPVVEAGMPARAYAVRVDLARALGRLSGPSAPALGEAIRSELGALAQGSSASGQRTSITAWVGGGGRVLRLQGSPPGAQLGVASMSMCCFGVPVRVTTPAPATVVDIASLTPAGERESNGGGDSDGG